MEWNFKERRQKRFRLAFAVVSLFFAAFSFLFSFSRLSKEYDVAEKTKRYEQKSEAIPLSEWRITLFACPEGRSELSGCSLLEEQVDVKFPLSESDLRKLALKTATHARAEIGRAGIKRLQRGDFDYDPVIGVLRSAHNNLVIRMGDKETNVHGMGNNGFLYLKKSESMPWDELTLEFQIKDLPWFGPSLFPPYLLKSELVSEFSEGATRLQFASDIQSQLEVGFPLLFAGVALVFDESPLFLYASVYGTLRALKSTMAFYMSHTDIELGQESFLIYSALNALCLVSLVFLVMSLTVFESITRKRIYYSTGLVAASFLFLQFWSFDFYVKADVYSDLVGCIASLIIVMIFIAQKFRTKELNGVTFSKCALLIAGLGTHLSANLFDLLSSDNGTLIKNPLDWKHSVLLPSLLSASLVNLGSVERKMKLFAKKFAESKILDHELNLAKEMQRQILPKRKQIGTNYRWRLMALPATSLAGDWADVAQVTVRDTGETFLVGCLIDVTGHGIGPAMATGTLCSQWNIWKKELAEGKLFESETSDRTRLLAKIVERMNASLNALGRNDSCTAALFLWAPHESCLYYMTCGHPGMLLYSTEPNFCKYLRTSFSGLGASLQNATGDDWVSTRIEVKERCTLALYSDGIIPLEKTFTKWIKDLRNAHAKSPQATSRLMCEQMRKNRFEFRSKMDSTDDITLMFLEINVVDP
jgi:serine phosphatase RsbU (regulator of sigma subunit)